MYELESDARAALSGVEEPAEWRIGAKEAPMPVPQLRSLRDFLEEIPDFRKARGRRQHRLLSDDRGRGAAGRLSRRERVRRVRRPLDEEQRKAVGGFWSPTRRRYTCRRPRPSITCSRRCRPTPWIRRCARGAPGMAAKRPWPWTARTCAAPRGRSGRKGA